VVDCTYAHLYRLNIVMATYRFRVADLDGKRHAFKHLDSAEDFAQGQVNASWSSDTWTVVDLEDNSRRFVRRSN
jgi:hypothetical protein